MPGRTALVLAAAITNLKRLQDGVAANVPPSEAGALFYAYTHELDGVQVPTHTRVMARDYGSRLASAVQVEAFCAAAQPAMKDDQLYPRSFKRLQFALITAEVVRACVAAGGVKSAADAITAARHLRGYDAWDARQEQAEMQLIKIAVPLLTLKNDILDFVCNLVSYRGLMIFSIAFGLTPSKTFDEAIEAHRQRLAEEERARESSAAL